MPIPHDDSEMGCHCGGKCGKCGGDMAPTMNGEMGCVNCGEMCGVLDSAKEILTRPAPPLHTTAGHASSDLEARYWALDATWNALLFTNVQPPPKDKPDAWMKYQAAHPEDREAVAEWRQLVQDRDAGKLTAKALDSAEADLRVIVMSGKAPNVAVPEAPASSSAGPPSFGAADDAVKAAEDKAREVIGQASKAAGEAVSKAASEAVDKAAEKVKEKVKDEADKAMGTAAKVGLVAGGVAVIGGGAFLIFRARKNRRAK